MSTESNSVMQVSLTTAMSPDLYRADEPMARKPERAQASFLDTIVGRRGGLRSILSQLKAVAPTNATVLITGETGTGKAVIAQAVHELSPRRTKNLVKVNCAAMPAGLLDSELFGHVRGAFTGAITSRTGRFTLADGGTLFLDEIGDMPLELQPKLLRVIREHEFEAVGSTRHHTGWMFESSLRRLEIYGKWFKIANFEKICITGCNSFPVILPPLRGKKRGHSRICEILCRAIRVFYGQSHRDHSRGNHASHCFPFLAWQCPRVAKLCGAGRHPFEGGCLSAGASAGTPDTTTQEREPHAGGHSSRGSSRRVPARQLEAQWSARCGRPAWIETHYFVLHDETTWHQAPMRP